MWTFVLGIIVASSPLVIGECLVRVFGIQKEYARKTIHVFGSLTCASLVLFLPLPQICLLGILFCFVLFIIRRYRVVSALYQIDRKSYGEIAFPAGVAAAAALSDSPQTFVIAMLVLGVSDTIASIVGGKWGTHPLKVMKIKSVEGSLAFYLSSLVILAPFDAVNLQSAALIALVATLAEAFVSQGLDNISIPVAITLGLRFL